MTGVWNYQMKGLSLPKEVKRGGGMAVATPALWPQQRGAATLQLGRARGSSP